MPYLELPDARIYYETHGPAVGTAPVIVFAHGAGGNHLSWWQQVPHFRDRYTCVSFDHRGWGQSAQTSGDRGGAAFVDDLEALLDALGIQKATLIAQSMGGWTCLGFALRHPERVERLVMCDTHGGLSAPEIDELWKVSAGLMQALPAGVHPAAGDRMYAERPDLHFLYVEIDALNSVTREQIGKAILAAGGTALVRGVELTMPVLFIMGEEDVVLPPKYLELAAAGVPGARIERFARAGHSVYFERPAEFNAAIDRFLGS
jgi:3-oxoadipate enol-lactonase